MATYYVDDGGSATSPYDTWAKAATSLSALDDAITFASGDIIYIGHDHVCQFAHSASRTITGSTSGGPVYLISATTGSDPPTYQKSSTNQVDTTEGAYNIDFSGGWQLYGVCIVAGKNCYLYGSVSTFLSTNDVTVKLPGTSASIATTGDGLGSRHYNLTVDLTGSPADSIPIFSSTAGTAQIAGLTFVAASGRTGTTVFSTGNLVRVSGADFSGIASSNELCALNFISEFANCLTAETWTPVLTASSQADGYAFLTNCGPADAPTYLYYTDMRGTCASSSAIYRSGGATVEGDNVSWLITTTAIAGEGTSFVTPYMYGTVSSTGSKTFDVYITNDTGDFDDSQVWLEVELLATADEAEWTLVTDQRSNSTGAFVSITETPDAQADDTTSTWNGTGPSFTYKQKLSVTATVNETGMYRARVAVGVASIASSRYFYIDPKVTVS